jgi:WhiB family transcriptional regulator, redox-sensing transcriptional regulator
MSMTPETGRRDSRSWRDRAACLDADPELFFPIGSTGPALAQIEEAKAVCARCPVLAECRTWAMENPRLAGFGVFGGMSEDERKAAARRARRQRSSASTD